MQGARLWYRPGMLNLSCLCGQIRVTVQKRPDFINECNCVFCSKSGARWGYFHPSEVQVEGEVNRYCREDKPDPAAELQFCARCGSTTNWRLTPSAVAKFGDAMMGVNMRLADEAELTGIELRFPDGRRWSGEGEFGHVREASVFGHGLVENDR